MKTTDSLSSVERGMLQALSARPLYTSFMLHTMDAETLQANICSGGTAIELCEA
jgi:hypothetical protein